MTERRVMRVAGVYTLHDSVKRVDFVPVRSGSVDPYPPGSHIGVVWGGARVNSYSLTGSSSLPDSWSISVLHRGDGAAGSAWVHRLHPGDTVDIIPPRSEFPPVTTARHHLLIAGGIGVTPILSHARWHSAWGNSFEVIYVHRPGFEVHLDDLREVCGGRLVEAVGREQFRIAYSRALDVAPFGSHVYTCGPQPLIDAVTAGALERGWPEQRIHSEQFAAAIEPGRRFTVVVQPEGLRVDVGGEQSMVDALETAGVRIPTMCRRGVCGECQTRVVAGTVDHRDLFLSDHDRADGYMMPCVSRAASDTLEIHP